MSEVVACQTHPTVAAVDRCAGCAEPFCGNCMVELFGARYCGSCKVMALKGQPMPEIGNISCKEATSALTLSIISLFVVYCPVAGFILAGVLAGSALAQAQKAAKLFNVDPRLTGKERMRAARIIAIIALIIAVIFFIAERLTESHTGGGGRRRY